MAPLKILFIHQAYASQFHRLIGYLLGTGEGHEITFLSSIEDREAKKRSLGDSGAPIEGVRHAYFKYRSGLKHKGALSVQRLADEALQGKAVFDACKEMQGQGYHPDIIVCHGRWGAGLFVKEAYLDVPLLLYSEFFATAENARQCLAPGETLPAEADVFYRLGNATNLISLEAADHIVTPTLFQRDSHPDIFHDKMSVIFDGIDAQTLTPRPATEIGFAGRTISHADEIVTFVTRNFDPYRGFETFVKAVEIIQAQRPNARILIGGGCEDKGYGLGPAGEAYRRRVLEAASLDRSRVHFLGPLSYEQFVHLLRFSQVHVYLTVPFVLSWSLVEAMSLQCAIVGSRTAPVEEVIRDGENGLLANFHAPDEVAGAVLALLSDKARREQLGMAARRTVLDNYSIEAVGPRFKALMTGLIDR